MSSARNVGSSQKGESKFDCNPKHLSYKEKNERCLFHSIGSAGDFQFKEDLLHTSFGHHARLEDGQSLLVAAEVRSITNMPHHVKIIVQHKHEHGLV